MSAYRSRNIVRIALGIASLLALLAAAFLVPPEARTGWPGWAEIVLTVALTAFMVNFAIPLPVGEGSLVHLAGLTALLIYDPTWAIAVVALGVLLGDSVRSLWPRGPSYRDVPWGERLGLLGLDIAQHVFGLLAALLGYLALGGRLPFGEFSAGNSIGLLGYALGFFLGFNALLYIDIRLRRDTVTRNIRLNRGGHLILELLPVPFAVYGALLHSTLGFFLYTSLAGLIAIITVVFYSFGWARVNAEKRLHELTRINKVSQAMRFSLDLDSLLETIYLQVASLLGVENFYIALQDLETDTIYFPIAIKEGEHTHWPARPFAQRLTDYVIRTSAPLLVPYDVPATIRRLGLEQGDNQPVAWMGVPLLSSERAIGCLAVLSYTPGGKIPIEAATFLGTVAAQAGVAIENAQMFGQTRRRAAELSTLTEISTAMAASLDPERVLKLVCSSVIRVFSAQKSAIFLLTEDRQTLVLARAKGLTEAFLSASRTLTMDNANRVKAVTSALPVVVPDVQTARIPADIAELAQTEGFGSYAELPLQAQGEMIGLLAVYFAGSHRFRGAEIDLLKTFAAQAALAVANARLYARTDQALARRVEQLQALEAISRELSSTLDSERLFNVILDRAMEFTGAAVSSLHLLDAEKGVLEVVASRGYPPDFARFMAVTNRSISARVQQAGEARLVPDVREDPDYADATHNTLSQLSVPIRSEGRTLGVITLESPALAAFSEDDARFISQLTAQAAVAIDNARLYRQVQDRLREQSLLYDSSAAITSSLDLSTTLHTVAQKIAEAMGAVACTISDLDPASGLVVRVAEFTNGATPPFVAAPYLLANYPARRRMLANREPFSVRLDASTAEPAEAELLRANGWQALLALPLVAATHVLGFVEVFADRPRDFTDAEVRLARTLAGQAGVAIENARLFQRITEGRDRLAAVLNSTREGVLMIDSAGRIALANPPVEEMWGIKRIDLIDKPLGELLHDARLGIADKLGFATQELADLLHNLSAGRIVTTPKHTYQIAAPAPRFFERSGTPVLDEHLRVIGLVIVLRDITEEKELEQMREELTSMIVHDLRSPMTAVVGGLKLIEDIAVPVDETGVVVRAVEVAIRSSKRLLTLVDTLLDISKMEAGQMRLDMKPQAFWSIAANVIAEFTPIAAQQEVTLVNDVLPDLPPLLVDQDKIERLLTNLIDNALKFTPSGGQVIVRARLPDESPSSAPRPGQSRRMALCGVLDTGPGIPDEYLERIFDRFVQVKGRKGRRRGTGLGLAFCKLAVEAHGGRIWVENRPEGGSAFLFILPTAE